MADDYTILDVDDIDPERSGKSRTPNIDLGEALGCEEMRPRLWFVDPGNDRKTYHSHHEQEEFYYVLSGPGQITIAGNTHTVSEDTAIRVPPETPRKVFNNTDSQHVWLVIGAPNVEDSGIVHEKLETHSDL
jgi:mannose-6-phosphate isomerase-like protein (cupin superfamily)